MIVCLLFGARFFLLLRESMQSVLPKPAVRLSYLISPPAVRFPPLWRTWSSPGRVACARLPNFVCLCMLPVTWTPKLAISKPAFFFKHVLADNFFSFHGNTPLGPICARRFLESPVFLCPVSQFFMSKHVAWWFSSPALHVVAPPRRVELPLSARFLPLGVPLGLIALPCPLFLLQTHQRIPWFFLKYFPHIAPRKWSLSLLADLDPVPSHGGGRHVMSKHPKPPSQNRRAGAFVEDDTFPGWGVPFYEGLFGWFIFEWTLWIVCFPDAFPLDLWPKNYSRVLSERYSSVGYFFCRFSNQ